MSNIVWESGNEEQTISPRRNYSPMSLLETPLEFCNVWEIVTTVAFRYVYSYSIYYVTMSDEDKSDMSASPQLQ